MEEEALVFEEPPFEFFVSAVGKEANEVAHSVILDHLDSFLWQSLIFVRAILLRHTDTFHVQHVFDSELVDVHYDFIELFVLVTKEFNFAQSLQSS